MDYKQRGDGQGGVYLRHDRQFNGSSVAIMKSAIVFVFCLAVVAGLISEHKTEKEYHTTTTHVPEPSQDLQPPKIGSKNYFYKDNVEPIHGSDKGSS
ncbi:unnamed protein product [Nezara viridula]|uniref:Uncharacterized protein n=1 Tax=Nezara viridula TaxID=85310 RepID=A0A9P0MNT8_NEZVI|nr:unnamed protein product [Nezara viridula]